MPTITTNCAHADVNGGRPPFAHVRYTAREHLTRVWINLLDARISADNAALQLSGARAARAAGLVAKLGDAIDYAQRLRVCLVEGDERAQQSSEGLNVNPEGLLAAFGHSEPGAEAVEFIRECLDSGAIVVEGEQATEAVR